MWGNRHDEDKQETPDGVTQVASPNVQSNLHGNHLAIISNFAFSSLSELELGPTIISNNPGSTTRRISSFRNESLSGVIMN